MNMHLVKFTQVAVFVLLATFLMPTLLVRADYFLYQHLCTLYDAICYEIHDNNNNNNIECKFYLGKCDNEIFIIAIMHLIITIITIIVNTN